MNMDTHQGSDNKQSNFNIATIELHTAQQDEGDKWMLCEEEAVSMAASQPGVCLPNLDSEIIGRHQP